MDRNILKTSRTNLNFPLNFKVLICCQTPLQTFRLNSTSVGWSGVGVDFAVSHLLLACKI